MDFSTSQVEEIEHALVGARAGGWRRVKVNEEAALSHFGLIAAWRVDVPKEWHCHPLIDHLIIGITARFPFADPVAVALQGISPGAPYWPHIDPCGGFCLGRLRYSSSASTRILTTLQDALFVLDMKQEERAAEHRREFIAYWSQLGKESSMPYRSVLEDVRASRDIVYSGDTKRGLVFAESADQLRMWLSRTGSSAPDAASTTRLIWLDRPLLPVEFPAAGRDVIALDDAGALVSHMRAGSVLPVVLGCEIEGAPVYVCAEIEGMSEAAARKGFRPSQPRPAAWVAMSFNAKPAVRRNVQRADYRAVHGRGMSTDVETLRGKSVAVVGCGALGGYLARALAQAGIGSLYLVDMDRLSSSNTGRHVLGMQSVGLAKSVALAKQLLGDFPSVVAIDAWIGSIEHANAEQQEVLSRCDLVIAAGISIAGELALNRWRLGLQCPPALLWTWLEEMAVTGHAVGIVDATDIAASLDADAQFAMRLTSNWPPREGQAVEAGCGVAYQPYSTSDMMGTINVAHRLALDILLGKVRDNVIRSWLGNREVAVNGRCTIDPAFDKSYCEISRKWAE
ncbi:ThiF family adenylyltransferase [Xanthomonas sp.]|uniref:ThiF family adenylyltransferase n=1 Tax=Xanthomonas sp. TaxID=29446 RepID=UPI001980FF72|nr:ThiF family adenylyltransferase [Xanthomonas sp.]